MTDNPTPEWAWMDGLIPMPAHHNLHPWCQPGDRPDRIWMLKFDDADMRTMMWTGEDAEKQARAAYAQYCPSWNCYLFATIPAADALAARDRQIAGLVEALRRIVDIHDTRAPNYNSEGDVTLPIPPTNCGTER